MSNLNVGDLVVSMCNPTCVQKVVTVKPLKISGREIPGDFVLTCVTVWRFDGSPISSKPNKPSMAWQYRRVCRAELIAARDRLNDVIKLQLESLTGSF